VGVSRVIGCMGGWPFVFMYVACRLILEFADESE
jgi:hypothetical protein